MDLSGSTVSNVNYYHHLFDCMAVLCLAAINSTVVLLIH